MFCSKCGKEVEKGVKFCPGCGTKVAETKTEEKKEVKKEVVKAEPVKQEEPQRSSGLGIAAMVIGIVSFILAWFLNIFIIVIPVVGLILALCAKGKKGFKITGIILNALSLVICVVMFIVSMVTLGRAIGTAVDDSIPQIKEGVKEVQKTVKSGYPYGTWYCVDYYDSEAKNYADNVRLAPSDKKTVLYLYTDNTFKYGPYSESYKNYYKGTFKYTLETEKNEQYKNKNVTFIDVETTINDAMMDGVKNYDATGMHFEMELLGEDDYDTALMLYYNTYNTYYCQR